MCFLLAAIQSGPAREKIFFEGGNTDIVGYQLSLAGKCWDLRRYFPFLYDDPYAEQKQKNTTYYDKDDYSLSTASFLKVRFREYGSN